MTTRKPRITIKVGRSLENGVRCYAVRGGSEVATRQNFTHVIYALRFAVRQAAERGGVLMIDPDVAVALVESTVTI